MLRGGVHVCVIQKLCMEDGVINQGSDSTSWGAQRGSKQRYLVSLGPRPAYPEI